MFSSYFWNYEICDSIAKLAKADGKITIVGGPQIGTNEPSFLQSRIYYDYFCKPTKPGEVFIQDFIDEWFENEKPNESNISWELRSDKTRDYRLEELDYSVYEDNFEYLQKIVNYARDQKLEPFITLETTRGCPYSCVFCEWGGGTGTKIYKKNIDVVKRDILALKGAGYISANSTDANFGVFEERDIEILKFAWENGFNLTDISTLKSKDLKRRIRLVDAWFDVIKRKPQGDISTEQEEDMWNRTKHLSVVPTVSIQSVSEEAMKIANRVDLSLKDKIKLSEHIGRRTTESGYPVPALELILAMPGSTLDDFYAEMEIIWNFKCWGLRRHDYMFFPDSDMSSESYLEKYKIKLVDVYTDTGDEDSKDNLYSTIYKNNKSYFKTITECYSFTHEEFLEMVFMNYAGIFVLQNIYEEYQSYYTPSEFTKTCFSIIKDLEGFDEIYAKLADIYNPRTEPKCIRRIDGIDRSEYIEEYLNENIFFIKNGIAINALLDQ